jgi:integrase
MASVRSDDGWLFLDFRYRGERCREYLNLQSSRDGRTEANRKKRRLEAEIRAGIFNYSDFFPDSSRAERFGIRPQRGPTFADSHASGLKNCRIWHNPRPIGIAVY